MIWISGAKIRQFFEADFSYIALLFVVTIQVGGEADKIEQDWTRSDKSDNSDKSDGGSNKAVKSIL